jgi:hypothetical protein
LATKVSGLVEPEPGHEPEKLEDLINKLKDENYVRDNLKTEEEGLTPE